MGRPAVVDPLLVPALTRDLWHAAPTTSVVAAGCGLCQGEVIGLRVGTRS